MLSSLILGYDLYCFGREKDVMTKLIAELIHERYDGGKLLQHAFI